MNTVQPAVAVIVILLCNCAYQKLESLIAEPDGAGTPRLAVTVRQPVVEDLRKNADTRDIVTSKLALPGRSDRVAPALTPDHREFLGKEFAKYQNGSASDPLAICTIQVVEGSKQYTSSWSGEEMRVRSKLRVSLFDSAHMPAPLSTTGEAEFFFTSTSANTLNFDRLYQKAMKTALFKAMESLSGALNSPAHP